MSFLKQFSDRIEGQNWNHVGFLRNMLLLLAIVMLFFYIWLFTLNLNGVVSPLYFETSLTSLLYGNIVGIIFGICINFLVLIPYYYKKEWDLHKVVPSGLFFHLVFSIFIFTYNFFSSWQTQITETAILTGFLLGGLIPILAYAGEVEKEHLDEDELLED